MMTIAGHENCGPDAHSTGADGTDLEIQALTPDGQMACNHCFRPIFWCETDLQWHHAVDSAEGCFLISAEAAQVRCGGFEGTDAEVDDHRATGVHNDEAQAGGNQRHGAGPTGSASAGPTR